MVHRIFLDHEYTWKRDHYRIAVDDADEQHIWVTRSGYSAGPEVYESFNGGGSWTNISGNLPNLPVNAFSTDTANDGVYIGTDAGVYYRNNDLADWIYIYARFAQRRCE